MKYEKVIRNFWLAAAFGLAVGTYWFIYKNFEMFVGSYNYFYLVGLLCGVVHYVIAIGKAKLPLASCTGLVLPFLLITIDVKWFLFLFVLIFILGHLVYVSKKRPQLVLLIFFFSFSFLYNYFFENKINDGCIFVLVMFLTLYIGYMGYWLYDTRENDLLQRIKL